MLIGSHSEKREVIGWVKVSYSTPLTIEFVGVAVALYSILFSLVTTPILLYVCIHTRFYHKIIVVFTITT